MLTYNSGYNSLSRMNHQVFQTWVRTCAFQKRRHIDRNVAVNAVLRDRQMFSHVDGPVMGLNLENSHLDCTYSTNHLTPSNNYYHLIIFNHFIASHKVWTYNYAW